MNVIVTINYNWLFKCTPQHWSGVDGGGGRWGGGRWGGEVDGGEVDGGEVDGGVDGGGLKVFPHNRNRNPE